MLYFTILVALASTLLYVNTVVSEIITSIVNPYRKDNGEEDNRIGKFKLVLIFIMSVFWSAVIYYM